MGSKARVAKYIVPIIQKCIDDNNIKEYIEPFVGGSNVIEHITCDTKFGFDSNEYLIEFWKAIQDGWQPFKEIEMTKEFYNEVKDNKELFPKRIVALCGLCATYNAKWFGGYAGIVTTKIGTQRNYYDESVRNVLKQADKIRNIKYSTVDFYNTKTYENAVIYCDPPYQGTTKYKDDFDYINYWNKIRELSTMNFVLCSEYNAPCDFECIWSKDLTTTLDKNSRSKATEKLFTYKNGKYYKKRNK